MPGEGSIYRLPNGRWVAQLSIGGRTVRTYRKRIRKTRAEAHEALAELVGDHRAGLNPSRLLISAYLTRWVREVRNIRPATRHAYANAIEFHLVPLIGEVPLTQLAPMHVERLIGQLAERLSPKSALNTFAVLRRALNMAVRMGLLARNVAARQFVDAPRVPATEPRSLSRDELGRVLEAAKGDLLEALILTAAGTGLRQGELLGLAWEDLDLESGWFIVRKELVRRAGKYHREEPKTPRSRRTVPLAPSIVAALVAHRARLIAAGFTPIATGPVFVTARGRPLNGTWVTHRFQAIARQAGVNPVGFRNLRTTFASRLFEEGVPDRRIADLLGHTRVATTQGHYIETAGASSDAAIAAIERLVG
jgi:integrase